MMDEALAKDDKGTTEELNPHSDLPHGQERVAKDDRPTPSVGRIVHYYPTRMPPSEDLPELRAEPQPQAAVISYVWSRDVVNLVLFGQGVVSGQQPVEYMTSVRYAEAGPNARWCWPPRV